MTLLIGVLCMAVNKWLCGLGCIVTPRDRTVKVGRCNLKA